MEPQEQEWAAFGEASEPISLENKLQGPMDVTMETNLSKWSEFLWRRV